MSVFKRKYGRLGRLSRRMWLDKLYNSHNPLFDRKESPLEMPGPTATKEGVLGGVFFMELNAFERVASRDQSKFLSELMGNNPRAAREYVLVILKKIIEWKEDMGWFKFLIKYLKESESTLKKEIELLKEEERLNAMEQVPRRLKKHFPEIFNDLEVNLPDFSTIVNKIKEILDRVEHREHTVKEYILEARTEMPFLFE